eukprot:7013295-Prymnesium_polylepis.2
MYSCTRANSTSRTYGASLEDTGPSTSSRKNVRCSSLPPTSIQLWRPLSTRKWLRARAAVTSEGATSTSRTAIAIS